MSNIFTGNDLNGIFNSLTDTELSLPTWIKSNEQENSDYNTFKQSGGNNLSPTSTDYRSDIFASKNILSPTSSFHNYNSSATSMNNASQLNKGDIYSDTSYNNSQLGGGAYFSETSYDNLQVGGNDFLSQTSLNNESQMNIGNVYSATSTELNSKDIDKLISMLTSESSSNANTTTEALEKQLHDILNKDNKVQAGGKSNYEDIKKFFYELKSQGIDVKLNNKTASDFFGGGITSNNTTTELTDSSVVYNAIGGGKKGTENVGFNAFLKLKKFVAEKLKISNGPKAGKIAGMVQRDAKTQNPELKDSVKISEKAKELFEKKMNHYKELL
jgi:hypothetical protein